MDLALTNFGHSGLKHVFDHFGLGLGLGSLDALLSLYLYVHTVCAYIISYVHMYIYIVYLCIQIYIRTIYVSSIQMYVQRCIYAPACMPVRMFVCMTYVEDILSMYEMHMHMYKYNALVCMLHACEYTMPTFMLQCPYLRYLTLQYSERYCAILHYITTAIQLVVPVVK